MTRQRANPSASGTPSRPVLWWSLALGTAAVIGVLVVTLGGGNGDGTLVGSGECEPVDEISHVHGLAHAAGNSSTIYVATHHGLLRVSSDGEICRLGPVADYMGFTMHPWEGDTFWVSGHPGSVADRMELGNNMGVLRSTDGGHNWEQIALEGVDFHAMTVSTAEPDRLWGEYRGDVYRSDDGGHEWDVVGQTVEPFHALTSHPKDPDTVYAARGSGAAISTDGGATWETFIERSVRTLIAHPEAEDTLFAVFAEGLHRSNDGGTEWTQVALDTGDDPIVQLAIEPASERMVAATASGALYVSSDGGTSWERLV